MNKLQQIKEEYAKERLFESWDDMKSSQPIALEMHMDEVSKRYAREVAKASLKEASENVELNVDYQDWAFDKDKVDSESITDHRNIVLL